MSSVESGTTSSGLNTPAPISFLPTSAGVELVSIHSTGTAHLPYPDVKNFSPSVDPIRIPVSILPPERLSYLSFNNPALIADDGEVPLVAQNIPIVASPFGKGVDFNAQNIELKYAAFKGDQIPVVEPDGSTRYSLGTPNIRRNEGTVRFWFSPNWSSGAGPAGGIFLDMMAAAWTLQVVNNGNTMQLNSAYGASSAVSSWPLKFVAGNWYQIALTYTPTETILYTNGVKVGSIGPGIIPMPVNVLSSFHVGSDGGTRQVNGIMGEVEMFNYEMSAPQIASDYQTAAATDSDGDGIPDIIEFEQGIDPSNPPGGMDNPPTPTGTDSGAPIIQITEPINSN